MIDLRYRLTSVVAGVALVYFGLISAAAFCEPMLLKFGLSRTEWAYMDYVEPIAAATAMFSQIGTTLLYGVVALHISKRARMVSGHWLLNPLTCISGWLLYFLIRPGSSPPQYSANLTLFGALPCGLVLWLYSNYFGRWMKK